MAAITDSRGILSAFKRSARIFYGSAGRAAKIAIAQTTLLVLSVAFDLRLDISQSVSSNKMNLPSEAVLYMIELVLSRKRDRVSHAETRLLDLWRRGEDGVFVGTGVRGVLVGRRVAVGVTRLTGIINCCPT